MKSSAFSTILTAGVGLTALLPSVLKAAMPQRQASKPNILFILADDLGYADLGCYGNKVIQTPVIDRLSREGMRFIDFYAGASVSSPSRCCLMTGLHTGHSRIRGNTCRTGGLEGDREGVAGKVRRISLQPEDRTMGDLLRGQGYRTCLVNKWHMDGFDTTAGPLDRGFDEFYGWLIYEPRSQNFYPDVRWNNRIRYEIPANQNGLHGDHNTDRSTDEAIAFLQRMAGKTGKTGSGEMVRQPFFLYLAYNAPHVPLDVKDRKRYEQSGLPETDQSYAALISQMDDGIGRVLQTLKDLGLSENTLVVFASDNGGATAAKLETLKPNGGFRGWKGELYEGGLRVPVIVKWPGHIKPGALSDQPAYFPDFFATFGALTGASVKGTDGINLLPVLTGKSKPVYNRFLYWEQFPRKGISQAVRYGDWKAVRLQQTEPWQLFNLKTDPAETTDVASNYPKLLKKLAAFAGKSHVESPYWPAEF
ncbi:MAG: arylsulfatase [Bacteroidota bacterium]|nr:arylsulfatase [Bacteroidota bacterium]